MNCHRTMNQSKAHSSESKIVSACVTQILYLAGKKLARCIYTSVNFNDEEKRLIKFTTDWIYNRHQTLIHSTGSARRPWTLQENKIIFEQFLSGKGTTSHQIIQNISLHDFAQLTSQLRRYFFLVFSSFFNRLLSNINLEF
jgi:hypothetical protein